MPLAGHFDDSGGRFLAGLAAVPQASIAAAAAGTTLLAAVLAASAIPFETADLPALRELPFFILSAAVLIGAAIVISAFVTAFQICLFGLPLVVLLGRFVRHPLALALALIDAGVGAFLAATSGRLGIAGGSSALPIILCYAVAAGYFYRRFTIAMRDFGGIA